MYHLTKIASRCEEFKSTANDAPAVPSHDPYSVQDPNYQRTAIMAHASMDATHTSQNSRDLDAKSISFVRRSV